MLSFIKNTIRFNSVIQNKLISHLRELSSYSLVYEQYGNPIDVLKLVDTTSDVILPDLRPEEVLIKFEASPINPADINTIQGVYAIKPQLPAVAGNEGCAIVLKVGSGVRNLQIGDKVVMGKSSTGTWRTHARGHFSDFIKIDKRLDVISASQIIVNPSTAYRMLKDFEILKQGDTVLQNGANSAVGKNVIQLCKKWNLVSLNVVRKRESKHELDELISELYDLGGNYVITDEQLEDKEYMANLFKQVAKPKLAFNCVGGSNALNCLKYLDKNGSFVTYGAMAKRPIPIGAAPLIFKNIKVLGFWVTNWYKENSDTVERKVMLDSIVSDYLNGTLKSIQPIPFKLSQYKQAINTSMAGNVKGKVTLVH